MSIKTNWRSQNGLKSSIMLTSKFIVHMKICPTRCSLNVDETSSQHQMDTETHVIISSEVPKGTLYNFIMSWFSFGLGVFCFKKTFSLNLTLHPLPWLKYQGGPFIQFWTHIWKTKGWWLKPSLYTSDKAKRFQICPLNFQHR